MNLNELKSKVLAKTNIVDVIGEEVELHRKGKNYLGLCPFHEDNNPSFTVSEEKQIYKCFVCGNGGDVFKFIEQYNHLSYTNAVIQLAKKANIDYQLDTTSVTKAPMSTNEIILQDISKYYITALAQTKGGEYARQYLQSRKISPETIQHFELGYAHDDDQTLYKYLEHRIENEEKYSVSDVEMTNHFTFKNDIFKSRLIIPIYSEQDKLVGFGGRTLNDDTVKYLNSKESESFKKNTLLFNLAPAVKNTVDNSLVIVEGYFDVIAAYEKQVRNCVAVLGTAFNENHLKNIPKRIKTIYLAFDNDNAGLTATLKSGAIIANQSQLEVRVINLQNYKDLGEFFEEKTYDDFENLKNNSVLFKNYQAEQLGKSVNTNNQMEVHNYLLNVFENTKDLNPIAKQQLLTQTAKVTSLSEGFIDENYAKKATSVVIARSRIQPQSQDEAINNYDQYDGQYMPEMSDEFIGDMSVYATESIANNPANNQIETQLKGLYFTDTSLKIIYRCLTTADNYESIKFQLIEKRKKLERFDHVFQNLEQYYQKYNDFNVLNYIDMYPQEKDVITYIVNKKKEDKSHEIGIISDQELIEQLKRRTINMKILQRKK